MEQKEIISFLRPERVSRRYFHRPVSVLGKQWGKYHSQSYLEKCHESHAEISVSVVEPANERITHSPHFPPRSETHKFNRSHEEFAFGRLICIKVRTEFHQKKRGFLQSALSECSHIVLLYANSLHISLDRSIKHRFLRGSHSGDEFCLSYVGAPEMRVPCQRLREGYRKNCKVPGDAWCTRESRTNDESHSTSLLRAGSTAAKSQNISRRDSDGTNSCSILRR